MPHQGIIRIARDLLDRCRVLAGLSDGRNVQLVEAWNEWLEDVSYHTLGFSMCICSCMNNKVLHSAYSSTLNCHPLAVEPRLTGKVQPGRQGKVMEAWVTGGWDGFHCDWSVVVVWYRLCLAGYSPCFVKSKLLAACLHQLA